MEAPGLAPPQPRRRQPAGLFVLCREQMPSFQHPALKSRLGDTSVSLLILANEGLSVWVALVLLAHWRWDISTFPLKTLKNGPLEYEGPISAHACVEFTLRNTSLARNPDPGL